MHKILTLFGVTLVIMAFIAGFIAYFIFKYDPATGRTYDGLGRSLTKSPWFMRLIFGEDKLWVGWKWFIGDMVIFWTLIGVGMSIATSGSSSRRLKR